MQFLNVKFQFELNHGRWDLIGSWAVGFGRPLHGPDWSSGVSLCTKIPGDPRNMALVTIVIDAEEAPGATARLLAAERMLQRRIAA